MGIQVECPHGHVFKVKDKYAGKKGLCPHCEGQVHGASSRRAHRERIERHSAARSDSAPAGRQHHEPRRHRAIRTCSTIRPINPRRRSGTSGSLLGSSVIRHNIKCKCGQHVPMWYARCPACGAYLDH